MKVIDTHTHFPGRSFGGIPQSGEELREAFASEGLSGAWIMTTDGLLGDPEKHNDLLAEGVRDHRDFFVPLCTVSPHAGADKAIAELERATSELGMRGLKLHSWLQAFSLTHPAVTPILEAAGRLSLPVLLHDGTPPYATPLQIAYAAEQAPETKIILGHSGLDDLHLDAILACLRQPNIYLCLCSLSAGYIAEAIERCPSEKLIFGSDGGFAPNLIAPAISKFEDLGVPEPILRKILSENSLEIMR